MTPAHIHLVLNHAPLFGLLGAMLLLLGGLLRKSHDVIRAGLLVAVATAIVAVPAYFSGENAEESIEHMQGVNEQAMEEHEDAATWVLVASSAAGIVALAGFALGRSNEQHLRTGATAVALVAAVGIGIAGYVNNLGGQIRHPEISTGATAQAPAAEQDAD
ncbi:MAG: hypothetical protein FGM24_05955 [Candidatus Kapabacteria bacterium]|nr:hypothetical protein [Candidatus Kapabacteria bacterium]